MLKLQLIQRIITTTTLAIAITSFGLALAVLSVNSSIAQSTTMVVTRSFRTPVHQTNQSLVGSTGHSAVGSCHRNEGGPLG